MDILTQKQNETVKALIQKELLKRSFTAKIIEFKEQVARLREARLILKTEPFQTMPVIFEEINIQNFSSGVRNVVMTRKDETEYNMKEFWIQINIAFTNFSGGTNGTRIFDLRGNFYEESSSINEYTIS